MPIPEYVVVATVSRLDGSDQMVRYLKFVTNYPVLSKDDVKLSFVPSWEDANFLLTREDAKVVMEQVGREIYQENQGVITFNGLGASLVGMGLCIPPHKKIELSVQKIEFTKLGSEEFIAGEDEESKILSKGVNTLSISRYVTGEQQPE